MRSENSSKENLTKLDPQTKRTGRDLSMKERDLTVRNSLDTMESIREAFEHGPELSVHEMNIPESTRCMI